MIEARAEPVGNLLRPDYLLAARSGQDDPAAAAESGVWEATQL